MIVGKPADKPFGERVRLAMTKRRISVESLAVQMNASTHTVHAWRYGRRVPRQIQKLALVLKTSVGALYGERV